MKFAVQTLRVPMSPLESGDAVLDERTARYVTRVHRRGAGEHFVAFDPEAGTEADVEIAVAGREVIVTVGEVRRSQNVAPPGLVLLQAIGKADKPEQVIRAATALGVAHVVFVESERAVVRVGDRADSRRKRWHAVAAEAARQSGRGDVPRITGPVPLADGVAAAPSTRRVYLSPTADAGLAKVIEGHRLGERLAVFVGPEGGLDDAEEATLVAAGFVPATLGPFVLRTEIAAVAVLGAIAALGREG
jgi:16S rRNA (uracil1498-N3)-methyltransferase